MEHRSFQELGYQELPRKPYPDFVQFLNLFMNND